MTFPRPFGASFPLAVNLERPVTAVYKHGTFVKYADFNLAFDKEEKTWRRTLSTRITITTTTTSR